MAEASSLRALISLAAWLRLSRTQRWSFSPAGDGWRLTSGERVRNEAKCRLRCREPANQHCGIYLPYDGMGERVKKSSGSTGTLYWRGMGNDTLAESNLSGTMQELYVFFDGRRVARRDVSGGAVHYYFSDHLGSHGVVNATGGTCEQDIDCYPFGGVEQDYCGTVSQNYKFNGKERDSESELHNFGARYNASSLGRFMTPDCERATTVPYVVFGDPQSLNLYAYVRNHPVSRADADGHVGDLPLRPSNPMAANQADGASASVAAAIGCACSRSSTAAGCAGCEALYTCCDMRMETCV